MLGGKSGTTEATIKLQTVLQIQFSDAITEDEKKDVKLHQANLNLPGRCQTRRVIMQVKQSCNGFTVSIHVRYHHVTLFLYGHILHSRISRFSRLAAHIHLLLGPCNFSLLTAPRVVSLLVTVLVKASNGVSARNV